MRRLCSSVLLACTAATALSAPTPAAEQGPGEANPSIDCGVPGAWTMIRRLPAVRTVIFDPVSNSFGFLACNGSGEKTLSNQEYLDRNRLALTTQKIRLLVLPYNPLEGDLTLTVGRPDGIEFAEIAGAGSGGGKGTGAGAQTPAAATPAGTGAAAPPAKPVDPKLSRALQRGSGDEQKALLKLLESTSDLQWKSGQFSVSASERQDYLGTESTRSEDLAEALDRFASAEISEPQRTDRLVAVFNQRFEDYKNRLADIDAGLSDVERALSCVDLRLRRMPADVSAGLAAVTNFTLGHDVTWKELWEELARRSQVLGDVTYRRCEGLAGADKDTKAPFEADIQALAALLDDTAALKKQADIVVAALSADVAKLVGRIAPSGVTQAEWIGDLVELQDSAESVGDAQKGRAEAIAALRAKVPKLEDEYLKMQHAFHSPAATMQRFNFPPLDPGKAISFTVQRGKASDDEKSAELVPNKKNALTLRSAPSYTYRVSAGAVVSRLEGSTFKTADFPAANSTAAAPATETRILLDERGDGRVLPGLFVNHYWLRRSPLLKPTVFEALVPTFSIGVPLAGTNAVLSDLFLGLSWEVAPGVQINAGKHFGRVNTLANGFKVGGVLPKNVSLEAIQEKRSDSDYYFGIVVNRDVFNVLRAGDN